MSSGFQSLQDGASPAIPPSHSAFRTLHPPATWIEGTGTPQSLRSSTGKPRRGKKKHSANSSVRSAGSNRQLPEGHTWVVAPPRSITNDSWPSQSTNGSTSTAERTEGTDQDTYYSATDLSETLSSSLKDRATTKPTLDEATTTVAKSTNEVTKLPPDFLRNVSQLLIHNVDPGSEGWFTSSDKSFQFVLNVQHGTPFVRHRSTNERRPLNEVLTFATSVQPSIPNKNYTERLGSGYSIRSSDFFTVGKVFSTLFTEPCSNPTKNPNSPKVTTVLFGERVYTQIMNFVVVQRGKGICYACPILTYDGRGTLKPGCNPQEHSIAYMQGSEPVVITGEKGITKLPIEIIPFAKNAEPLDSASRIRFGRGQVIQHSNAKVKEIGHVADPHIPRLIAYWREEICGEHDHEWVDVRKVIDTHDISESATLGEDNNEKITEANKEFTTVVENKQGHNSGPRREVVNINGFKYTIITEVGGQLHSGFNLIRNPRSFIKKGRCFMVFWPEPAGGAESERTIYWKIRRFVVIRNKPTYCLCLSISTYQGRGTSKAGVIHDNHAPVIPVDGEVQLHPDEKSFSKEPLRIKIEEPSISIDPMSRINFGKVFTVEYNLKVRNMGRIISESCKKMEEYFVESIKLPNEAKA